ncbi:peptidase [Gloeocapsa sp. PCC 73106]|uniref:peptidase n=1 Tax=Gloeocapsa sp. PCC 73106 TaxID=102232 RepID=UPI0002AC52E9|nr:peptidase [Gloeocapsa sp. PCC 73106]ELR98890.1 peptidase family protein [Gloeocapsa sp. PCC 73106]
MDTLKLLSSDLELDLGDFLPLLQTLIREPSVVGSEDSFFRVLMRELKEVGAQVDYYQGVLVAQGNHPEQLILSAHIDRHGLLCTGPNEFQYAAFIASNKADLNGDSVSEQMMYTVENRFQNQRVQAHLPYTGTYLGQGCIVNSYICPARKNLIFELDGLDFLQPGTPVSFLDRLEVKNGYASAQLDNVLSVAILVYLFRCGFQGTALFTAQEEAGRSWRYALSWFYRQHIATERLIVIDTSPYPTTEAANAQQLVLRHKDASAPFAVGITRELEQLCKTLGINITYKDIYIEEQNLTRTKPHSLGRTELGRLIAASDGKINGTTIQIPTTGYHTPHETASLSSIAAAIKLLMSYI